MCGYKNRLKQSYDKINAIESQIYKSKFGDIEYLVKGEGIPLLISHGVAGGIDQGIGLINSFFYKRYRFVFVSRFGYLQSTIPENPTVEKQADAFKDLLDHLGIESAVIYANSAGSTSVLQFALKYPQACSGLILQSANAPLGYNPGTPPKFIFKSNFLYWLFLKIFGKMMLTMFVPKSIIKQLSRNEKKLLMDEVFFSSLPVSERSKGVLFDMHISNPSIEEDIPFRNIQARALILNAIDDPATKISGARTLADKIPKAKLVEFDTGGHLLYNQDKEVKKEIDKFLESL